MIRLKVIFLVVFLLWTVPVLAVNAKQKLALLEPALEADAKAQYELALIYQDEAVDATGSFLEPGPDLWKKSIHWFEAASALGHLEAREALLMRP